MADLNAKAIEDLEARIGNANDEREIAFAALDFAESLWSSSGPKERIRILKYSQMAAECFLRLQMSFQAVWVLVWLREATNLWEESISLEQLLSHCLARKPQSRKKTTDEHLPVPTPFQEFSAKLSLDGGTGAEAVRDQLRNMPTSTSPLFALLKVGEAARLLRTADCIRLKVGEAVSQRLPRAR
jgi:hypothetical protein